MLKEQGFSPTCLFHNPNIHPYTEFRRRLDAMKVFAYETRATVIIDEHYGLDDFMANVFGKDERCLICYAMRLRETARICQKEQLERFTSTLLYSKHQKHEKIIEAGERAAAEFGVEFFYQDFREGWKEGIRMSKQMQLYRQQYCGCIFSEQERYMGNL